MRVVQLLPELNEGGVERGVVELSREFVKKEIESYVISNGGKLVETLEADGTIHIQYDICSKNILTVPFRIFGLKKILKALKPDIIHVRSRVPAWLVYFANKELKIKVVSTVHGFNSVSFYSRIMTKADHLICVSNAIKEYIQRHYQTPEKKITVIPRGVDLKKFNPDHIDHSFVKEFKDKYGLNGKFVVSTIGRITQLKDIETFIRSIEKVKLSIPHLKALIVGGVREDKQGYFKGLQNLVEELGLEDTIIFTGSKSQVAEIYALSDVIISSSKKPESFGRSVAEAIAMNTPVIATNHGGVLDIIVEGENGYFFNIGNDKELAQKLIKAKKLKFKGYNYISTTFNLEKMTTDTIKIYHKVQE